MQKVPVMENNECVEHNKLEEYNKILQKDFHVSVSEWMCASCEQVPMEARRRCQIPQRE